MISAVENRAVSVCLRTLAEQLGNLGIEVQEQSRSHVRYCWGSAMFLSYGPHEFGQLPQPARQLVTAHADLFNFHLHCR